MEVFKDYAKKVKEPVWSPFLNMLNRPDGFIVNQVSKSIVLVSRAPGRLLDTQTL